LQRNKSKTETGRKKQMKKAPNRGSNSYIYADSYAWLIASTGQTSEQAPQSVHSSALIEYTSPSEMQSTGHSSLQAPQAVHKSLSIV